MFLFVSHSSILESLLANLTTFSFTFLIFIHGLVYFFTSYHCIISLSGAYLPNFWSDNYLQKLPSYFLVTLLIFEMWFYC